MDVVQPLLHYSGHFLAPIALAWLIWRSRWEGAAALLLAANAIDIDHLLADPIFDPDRCSIGYHALHGWEAAAVFAALLLVPRWWVRAFALGALWHLAVDSGDCAMQTALI